MKKNIYIFTSKGYQPNLYINIIGSCFNDFSFQNIEDIYLLKIDDDSIEGSTRKNQKSNDSLSNQLKKIRKNIEIQINYLSKSKFLSWDKEKKDFENSASPKDIKIEKDFQNLYNQIYAKINEDEIRLKVIKIKSLETTLNRIINNPSYEFIFDLTGVPKKDFVSISLILLSKGCSIYIFETYRWFTYDEKDLIHHLLYIKHQDPDEKSYNHHHLNPKGYIVIRNIGKDHMKEMKKGWRDLVASNKIDKVISEIKKHLDKITSLDNELQTKLVNASSRYFDAKERLDKYIISKTEYDLEINRINSLLLDIIFQVE